MEKAIHSRRYRMLILQLQGYRKLNKIPQHELADRLGITQSQVSKIERCERRLDVLEMIDYCRAINLSADDIAGLILQISAMKDDDE
jgi:transcriptional regulator with XRE-family HTH domain